MIGRESETDRVIQILSRRQKNNPCLIGEPGVGKTAVVEGLAARIAEDLEMDQADVNIKATTEEHLGFTGAGEGISAHAVCLLCQ